MNRAEPEPEPEPPLPLDQLDNGDGNSVDGISRENIDDEDDDDEGDVAGPTVEAYVDLAKTACKYCMTIYHRAMLTMFTVCKVYPDDIAAEIEQPNFANLIQQFIYDQEHSDSDSNATSALPTFYGKITVYPSAVATFYAPSDISGIGGMCREFVQ